jgi:uncharacterized protein (DUF2141 family)
MIRPFLTLAALALPSAALATPVTADLSGLRAGGTLYVQLQTRDQFMSANRAGGEILRRVPAGSLSLALGDVPPGDYAISVWHDDNNNGRFDVGPRGAPEDGWATVGGEALRGAPTFDQVKFTVTAAPARIPLALHYGR